MKTEFVAGLTTFMTMAYIVALNPNLLTMPISGSIGHGIGLGMIIYTFMKIFSGKAKEVSWLTYAISALFIVKLFLAV